MEVKPREIIKIKRNINENDQLNLKNSKILDNSINRDIAQRNFLSTKIKEFDDNDLILINDIEQYLRIGGVDDNELTKIYKSILKNAA